MELYSKQLLWLLTMVGKAHKINECDKKARRACEYGYGSRKFTDGGHPLEKRLKNIIVSERIYYIL